jgi:creatinine amidohydrolase/Fe(II)-dependent formamide hydrolase-like protein
VRYELMLPHQIRAAIDGNWPVVLTLGVLEYHGAITPVRARPRCLWRSYRKASTSRGFQRTNGIPDPPARRASNLG